MFFFFSQSLLSSSFQKLALLESLELQFSKCGYLRSLVSQDLSEIVVKAIVGETSGAFFVCIQATSPNFISNPYIRHHHCGCHFFEKLASLQDVLLNDEWYQNSTGILSWSELQKLTSPSSHQYKDRPNSRPLGACGDGEVSCFTSSPLHFPVAVIYRNGFLFIHCTSCLRSTFVSL